MDKIKICINNPNYGIESGLKLGEHVRENYDLIEINEKRRQIYDFALNK